ncbi:MAG TPA: chorismate mutase [Kiritimatiellia bacterium]|nr:chorismate mutase [Kiritimatiellia bacterium]HRZ12444.1 chorismate mutase [Kiritimatiellia bacterium]HSA17798.1 chorismate mutase [Kiritimatiellia bacterium]
MADSRDTLSLDNIRNVLVRLEETILFGVLERAQFRQNAVIYRPDGVGRGLGGESLVQFLLHECERSHAKVRRYTSPDEHPFFHDLPAPILPAAAYDNPLRPNTLNINDRIWAAYVGEIIPFLCAPGDDGQWGSSSVNDVHLLQALSKRIHYGKFVAESKRRARPGAFDPLIRAGDSDGLRAVITNADVERGVLERVEHKASTYSREIEAIPGQLAASAASVRELYARWIIPMNKDVQVLYLLQPG